MTSKRVNLALQGGGAHGAFTWGVLDRLLEDEEIEFASISGTSAGALNGAALKAGLIANGREGAKANLDWLWTKIGATEASAMTGWMQAYLPPPAAVSHAIEYSPIYQMADFASRMFSPYAYGPFYQNPLKSIAAKFEYDKVCADEGPELFISATNVRTGKIRVFETHEITTEVLMASACLPTLFQAVEFKDPKTGNVEAFWDGGYTGNPALFPMFRQDLPDDIVVVNINPLERTSLPISPQDILNRINEISFNSSLLRELRAIRFVKELIQKGQVDKSTKTDVLVHMIADDTMMTQLSVATKTVPTPYILNELKEAGRRAAAQFLSYGKEKIGVEGTVNLDEMFGAA